MGCLKDFCYNVQKGLFITTKSKKKKDYWIEFKSNCFFLFLYKKYLKEKVFVDWIGKGGKKHLLINKNSGIEKEILGLVVELIYKVYRRQQKVF